MNEQLMSGSLVSSTPPRINVRHSSESNEHFTPADYCAAARATLGEIDLDPASCAEANDTVKAARWLGSFNNGFRQPWHGRIFLNPPGGRSDDQERPVIARCGESGECGMPPGHVHEGVSSSQKKWWFKLASEFADGRVHQAIFICFSLELLQTTQNDTPDDGRTESGVALIPLDFPICYPRSRVKYRKPGGAIGASPPHASAIILVTDDPCGAEVARFVASFGQFGRVVNPRR